MRPTATLAAACAISAAAFAQHDPNSVWPQFKANNSKTASVRAPRPATQLEWYIELMDSEGVSTIPSPGGFTLAGNGESGQRHSERDR